MGNALPQIQRPVRCEGRTFRIVLVFALATVLLSWPLANTVAATAGDLDPTFGSGGRVITDFFGKSDGARAVAIQPDGKIVAAGSVNSAETFGLARYNADGSLDSTFGSGGKVFTDLLVGTADAEAIAIQKDGKLVVGGTSFSLNVNDFVIARYNKDGSLDSTFGSGGVVTTDFFGSFDDLSDIAIQSDDKIVAAGQVDTGGLHFDFAVARYNVDGSLDSSFGSLGLVTTDLGSVVDSAQAVVIQGNNKIVLAGGTAFDFALARYNADGSLDATFGSGGRVVTDLFGLPEFANACALQADGRIVVAGFAFVDFALVRYNTDGSLDFTFGGTGKVITDFFGFEERANAVAIQQDGKLVVGGFASKNSMSTSSDFAIARYNIDGSLDSTFGLGGKVMTDFAGSRDEVFGIAIQSDGRIVAAGEAATDSSSSRLDFALARYSGDVVRFDICLQDDSNGNLLQFNSTTGDYQFTGCSAGLVLAGTGSLIQRGGVFTLQHYAADRRVLARVDTTVNRGTASVQIFSQGATFTITDRNTMNNSCSCP